jgi:hypothetical protein
MNMHVQCPKPDSKQNILLSGPPRITAQLNTSEGSNALSLTLPHTKVLLMHRTNRKAVNENTSTRSGGFRMHGGDAHRRYLHHTSHLKPEARLNHPLPEMLPADSSFAESPQKMSCGTQHRHNHIRTAIQSRHHS